MVLMTWIATIGYFIQTDVIAGAFADVASRTQALADIDLIVNIVSAAVALFGLSRFISLFGVTGSLVLNLILMAISFVLMAISPTLLMLQATQALRRVTQYAIARPSREICLTVVDQESRYKTKNIIDVVMYRLASRRPPGFRRASAGSVLECTRRSAWACSRRDAGVQSHGCSAESTSEGKR